MKRNIVKLTMLFLISLSFIFNSKEASAAGTAKPSEAGREASYEVINVKGSQGSGGTASKCGLFDGTQVNEWNTAKVMYWEEAGNYVDINIKEACNIWRSGTTPWDVYFGPLKILKWDGTQYNDITKSYTQTTSKINEKQWEKTISNLQPGTYRFETKGIRLDSEWYLEIADTATKSTLKVVLEVDEELQLSVDDDLNENTEMTWTSSENTVATVDGNGVVTALVPGNTVITVTSADGTYTDNINVLVVENAKDYRLAVDLKVGKSCRLTADDYTNTVPVTWTSLDPTVATVSDNGKVTAVSKGLTIITATDDKGNEIGQIYVRVRN